MVKINFLIIRMIQFIIYDGQVHQILKYATEEQSLNASIALSLFDCSENKPRKYESAKFLQLILFSVQRILMLCLPHSNKETMTGEKFG